MTWLEAAGGSGGPVGPPDVLVSVGHCCFSSVMVIDGAGMKTVAVWTTDAYDITGTDPAVTAADDSAARGVELPPTIDHTVIGKAALERTVVTASGTVSGRESVGRVPSGGEIVEYLGST